MKKLIKPVLGLGVLAYVFHAKLIEFSALGETLRSPRHALLALPLIALANVALGSRWFMLLRAQGLSSKWARVQQVHWATAFLGLVLPGSLGTDVAKIWYLVGDEPNRKGAALFGILADRVVGAATLLLVGAISLAVFRADFAASPSLAWLARAFWIAAGALLAGGVVLYAFAHSIAALVDKLGISFVSRVVRALLAYRERPRELLLAALFSLFTIAFTVSVNAILAHWLGLALPPSRFSYVVPIASLAGYFGFLPLNLGVGQLVYFHLFSWLGMPHPDVAASLCTLLQIYNLVICLSGGAAFFWRRQPASAQVDPRLRRAG